MLAARQRARQSSRSLPSWLAGRHVHHLSKVFVPSGNYGQKTAPESGQGHLNLLAAGYIRQSASGIFSILPIGQRVLDKIEHRIDGIMAGLGASKLSLPTLATRTLWDTTGRWQSSGQELMKLKDRKGADLCLSPTHEESITRLVAGELNGWRQLPIRVYQIGRKFRDEMRPRGGMLRGREFIMKDLYTFDNGQEAADATYNQVRAAYAKFFDSLEVEYFVAEADSGNIGGDKSHEYHLPSKVGEDTLLKCQACDYLANQELARTNLDGTEDAVTLTYGHQDYPDSVIFAIELPEGREINPIQLLREAQKLDPSVTALQNIGYNVALRPTHGKTVHRIDSAAVLKVGASNACPKCQNGKLEEVQAVEIGHTFHLGTKYSEPLGLTYTNAENKVQYPEMGCHGIGVTRLLATLAEIKSDQYGLQWPTGLEPYKSVLVVEKGLEQIGSQIAQHCNFDALDDRTQKSVAYRVHDLHFKGVPCVYTIGKGFYKMNGGILWPNQALADLTADRIGRVTIEHVAQRGDFSRDWKELKLKDLQLV